MQAKFVFVASSTQEWTTFVNFMLSRDSQALCAYSAYIYTGIVKCKQRREKGLEVTLRACFGVQHDELNPGSVSLS